MKYLAVFIFFIINSSNGIIKTRDKIDVKINNGIQSLNQQEVGILHLWSEYLNSIDTIKYNPSPLWLQEEYDSYRIPDLDLIEIATQTKHFTKYTPTLLSIQLKDSIYCLKTAFIDSSSNIHSIYNVLAKKDDQGDFKFFRFQSNYTRHWKKFTVRNITYYYSDQHKLNISLAERNADFSDSLARIFKTESIAFKYYVFRNTEDRLRSEGYDYNYLMYNTIQESADTDLNNLIISSGKGGEYDPHEIVHIYLYQLYWSTLSRFFDEGLATFLGGNVERSKVTELNNLKIFLIKNPDLNLNNLVSLQRISENRTNISYALSAFICRQVYNSKGMKGLIKLCLAGKMDTDVYRVIDELLNVKRADLNKYLSHEINIAIY